MNLKRYKILFVILSGSLFLREILFCIRSLKVYIFGYKSRYIRYISFEKFALPNLDYLIFL